MKRVTVSIVLSLLIMVMAGCAPSISVTHDYDSAYNFSNLKTYAWIPIKAGLVSELKIKRFQDAIDKELQAKGMTINNENPDFLIALQGTTENKVNVTDYGYGYGGWYGHGYGYGGHNVDVTTYKEGTLFLDFVDARSKEMFWRGAGTSVVEPDLTAEEQENKFAVAASKLLAPFPPVAK
jgi:hypothetical protein